MSGKEISDLPNEIIIKVLRYLNQADLPNAILTCKLWENFIESSCPWSLKLHQYDEPRINFLLTTNRKFQKIELKGKLVFEWNKTIEIFRRHGSDVVALSLSDIEIDSYTKFAEILKLMPNLRELTTLQIVTPVLFVDVPTDDNLPELTKLKTLQMARTKYSILKCLKKAKLTTIKVLNSTLYFSKNCSDLEDFLKSQNMLTTLAIRSIYHNSSMLFRTQNLKTSMPFQLTKLSLLYIQLNLENPNNYNNLLKFLEPQAKTLRELELGHRFPSLVYEFVFAKMTNLKTLNLMMGEIPQEKELFERLAVNRSIKNLIFKESPRNNNESVQFFRDFLKRLPNVESLTILEDCYKEIIVAIAQSLKKLKTLWVGQLIGFHGVQFANLNALHIEYHIEDNFDWDEFTKSNSRLTELTIQNIDDANCLNVDDIENITTNNNLHTLRLGEGFAADKRFLEIIRKNCPDLKKLELHQSCGLLKKHYDHSDLTGVLRFFESDFVECPNYSTFWEGFLYHDEDVWDEGEDVLDPFDIHMMDVDAAEQALDDDNDDELDEERYYSNDDDRGFEGNHGGNYYDWP